MTEMELIVARAAEAAANAARVALVKAREALKLVEKHVADAELSASLASSRSEWVRRRLERREAS